MRRFQYILEHVVTNVDEVTAFAEKIAKTVKAPEAKAWVAKRLRAHILNSEELLTRLETHDIALGMPEYVQIAAAKGEPIYRFNQPGTEFMTRLDHLLDFFDALHRVTKERAQNPVAEEHRRLSGKILSKLQKMTFEQAEEAHEKWTKRVFGKATNLSKEGVEVVYTFGDGFYWVRYTERDTMMRDGHDLQNCLRTGTYWSSVQSGRQSIYGLRKPNDEAVVGMRVNDTNNAVEECKGKNNKVPVPQYVPYVVQFLKHLGVRSTSTDLINTGIFIGSGGEVGSWDDIADTIYTGNGIRVTGVVTPNDVRYRVLINGEAVWIAGDPKKTLSVTIQDEAKVPPSKLAAALRIIFPKDELRQNMWDYATSLKLRNIGVFLADDGIGTAEEVGETIWEGSSISGEEGDRAVKVTLNGNGYLFVYLAGDSDFFRFELLGDVISEAPADDRFLKQCIPMLNDTGILLGSRLGKTMWQYGYYRYGNKYVSVDQVGNVVKSYYGSELYEAPREVGHFFMLKHGPEDYSSYIITRNGKLSAVNIPTHNTKPVTATVQYLVERFPIDNLGNSPLDHIGSGLVFDNSEGRFRANLPKVVEEFRRLKNSPAGFDERLRDTEMLLQNSFMAEREKTGELPPKIQHAIFMALRPNKTEAFGVRRSSRVLGGANIEFFSISISILVCLKKLLPTKEQEINKIIEYVREQIHKTVKKKQNTINVIDNDLVDASNRLPREIDDVTAAVTRDAIEQLRKLKNGAREDQFAIFNLLNRLRSHK